MKVSRFFLAWLVLLCVCFLVRLPHLLSTHSYIDEDEAIIGLMAQDILEGRTWSYYFYGQNYGLSIIESLSSSLFIKVLGNTTMALRLGGLLIFSFGLTFLYSSFKRENLSQLSVLLLMLLLATFPTWYLWGSLVRGGYLTAFAFACIIYWITTRNENKRFSAIILGALAFFTFDGHPLLLLPVIPFLLNWWLNSEKKWLNALQFSASFAAVFALVKLLFTNPEYNSGSNVSLGNISLTNFITQIESWDHGFSGFFYYFANLEIPMYWQIGIYLMCFLLFTTITLLVLKTFEQNRIVILSSLVCFLIGLFLLSTIEKLTPRYFIGIYTVILFLLVYLASKNTNKYQNLLLGILTAVSIVGITAGSKLRRTWVKDISLKYEINEVHKYVEKTNAKAIIALDHQFTWNYFYGDKIPASGLCWNNRTNQFSHKVEKIYRESPKDVGLFGLTFLPMGLENTASFSTDKVQITSIYFYLKDVTLEQLKTARNKTICEFD